MEATGLDFSGEAKLRSRLIAPERLADRRTAITPSGALAITSRR